MGEPITLRTVSALLADAGVEFHVADLVMSDVISDEALPLLSEDAAAVFCRQVEVEAERRRLREALIQAADALEGHRDPALVRHGLAQAVTA